MQGGATWGVEVQDSAVAWLPVAWLPVARPRAPAFGLRHVPFRLLVSSTICNRTRLQPAASANDRPYPPHLCPVPAPQRLWWAWHGAVTQSCWRW